VLFDGGDALDGGWEQRLAGLPDADRHTALALVEVRRSCGSSTPPKA